MIKTIWIVLYGIVALAAQGILGHLGVSATLIPQLLVIIVVSLSFTEVNAFGCFMSFAMGLLLDFSSAILIGPWAGSFVVLYCALALLSRRLFIDSGVAAMFITFCAVVVTNVLSSLLGTEYPVLSWDYPQKVLGQALVTALSAPVVLGILSRRARKGGSPLVNRGSAMSMV